MRKHQLLFIIPFLLILTSSFAQKQGVKGQLFWISGNQMPGPEKGSIPKQGVVREIFVYELATLAEVDQEDIYFKKIHSKLIARAFSKTDGTFKIKLAPGKYSVFVKENKGLYANLFDGEGYISPITVLAKKYSWLTITIDYEAAY